MNVLIVPARPNEFLPYPPESGIYMAEYDITLRFFTILPISVPTIMIRFNVS